MKKLKTFEDLFIDYRKLAKLNNEKLVFYYDTIKLMHQIIQDVNRVNFLQYKKNPKNLTQIDSILQIYEIRILHYFMAHYWLIKKGVIYSSYMPLRSIYESILRIYFILINKNLNNLIIKIELGEINDHCTFKTSNIEKKIYDSLTQKKVRQFYQSLCIFTHPNIDSAESSFVYKEEPFFDSYMVGLLLAYSNLIMIFELYNSKIKTKYRLKVLNSLNKFSYYFDEKFPNFIPSKNNVSIKIKTPEDFYNFLKI